jgi:hypothetical protein
MRTSLVSLRTVSTLCRQLLDWLLFGQYYAPFLENPIKVSKVVAGSASCEYFYGLNQIIDPPSFLSSVSPSGNYGVSNDHYLDGRTCSGSSQSTVSGYAGTRAKPQRAGTRISQNHKVMAPSAFQHSHIRDAPEAQIII